MLEQVVIDFETMTHAVGPISTSLWLRDYVQYVHQTDSFDMFGMGEHLWGSAEENATAPVQRRGVNLEYLPDFIEDPRYHHYEADVKWSRGKRNKISVDRFMFTTIYRNTSDWSTKVDLMIQWRTIAKKYPLLNLTVFEASSHFIDQIISIKSVTVTSTLFTFICMALVCVLFIPSPFSVICACVAIAGISLGKWQDVKA